MYNIGIIGKGFVGSAAAHGFSEAVGYKAGIRIYDKIESRSNATLSETVNESDFLFVSVPTPANDDGSIHLDILDECLNDIDNVNKRNDNIILIRSTIIPGTSRSGIVYSGGRFLNISRIEALRFAMLLSIPTILLSAFIPTYKFIESPSSEFLLMGTVGLIVSFATAYLSISLLMNWVRNFSMVPFVVYRIILGSILLVYSIV